MEFAPKPEEPGPDPVQQMREMKVVVRWELFLSSTGLILCILFGAGRALGYLGDWATIWSPLSLVIGLQLHLLFLTYRTISYMFALIFEVSPVMRNMTGVLQGLFQGRTGG